MPQVTIGALHGMLLSLLVKVDIDFAVANNDSAAVWPKVLDQHCNSEELCSWHCLDFPFEWERGTPLQIVERAVFCFFIVAMPHPHLRISGKEENSPPEASVPYVPEGHHPSVRLSGS